MTDPFIESKRDLTIESYRKDDDWTSPSSTFRVSPVVINEEAIVRGSPKFIPPYDTFLAYLEFKSKLPYYERWFLP